MNGEACTGRPWSPLSLVIALVVMTGCAATPPGQRTMDAQSSADIGRAAADIALDQVGAPYRYGGAGPAGFDCSGLVQFSYSRAGKLLPRTTGQLWSHTSTVKSGELRPGDLLFFSIAGKMQHVGLYVGDGRFVHAPSSGQTVTVASLDSNYYRAAFLWAGRPR